jgi:hypothetical protein
MAQELEEMEAEGDYSPSLRHSIEAGASGNFAPQTAPPQVNDFFGAPGNAAARQDSNLARQISKEKE